MWEGLVQAYFLAFCAYLCNIFKILEQSFVIIAFLLEIREPRRVLVLTTTLITFAVADAISLFIRRGNKQPMTEDKEWELDDAMSWLEFTHLISYMPS